MSSWDFGLQLLDAERMTRWGFRRSASFWVENASAEWKESQAPFYVVGRLTLLPKSALQPEACEPKFIDVTEHSTPDTQPLGSINRARLAAELASRKVRLGEATVDSVLEALPTAPPAPRPRFRTLTKLAAMSADCDLRTLFRCGLRIPPACRPEHSRAPAHRRISLPRSGMGPGPRFDPSRNLLLHPARHPDARGAL